METNSIEKYIIEAIEKCSSEELSSEIAKIIPLIKNDKLNQAFNECIELMQSLYRNQDMESYIQLNNFKNVLAEGLKH